MLILHTYNNLRLETSFQKEQTLRRDLQSVTDLVLGDTSLIVGVTTEALDLFGDGKDSAFVKKDSWGLLSFASVTVGSGDRKIQRSFLLGEQAPTSLKVCLYLAEHQTPLSLVGAARLLGDAYVPKSGLRPAFIDGQGYSQPEFIKGNTVTSNDSLPPVSNRLLKILVGLVDTQNRDKIEAQATVPDTIIQSFADSAYTIRSSGPIRLTSNIVKGHVLIKSDTLIEITRASCLENVVLIAPNIKIDSGFSGTLQVIATKSIVVGGNCNLRYPSCLILLKQRKTNEQPNISIGDYCHLSGIILTYAFQHDDLAKTKVELGKKTAFEGYIYTSGYLYLQGEVVGTVLSDYLSYRTLTTVYINYLVDATIDRNDLSQNFIGPPIFDNTGQNKIIAWLN
jgi:hypothetical protein